MKKIQFDDINGIEEVEEFDTQAEIITIESTDDLVFIGDGLYGAEVSKGLFKEIEEEFGVFR